MSETKKKPKRRREMAPPHVLPVEERRGNMKEVNLGYFTLDEVMVEVDRCYKCRKPFCEEACPAHYTVQDMFNALREGDLEGAFQVLCGFYAFPSSFNRICPAFCQDACIAGKKGDPIQILNVKRWVSDQFYEKRPDFFYEVDPPTGRKIAIIGAGVAGLTAAYFLRKKGHEVEVFEKAPIPGGMLTLGIPQYRLPNEILFHEVEEIEKMGVKFHYNVAYGKDITRESLMNQGFDAIFIAHGAHRGKSMWIIGDHLEGCLSAVEFLRDVALGKPTHLGERVAVIGGGDVAIDAARVAWRQGKHVEIFYRRSRNEMPATKTEIEEALAEGIKINFLTNPVEIIGDENGKVKAIKLILMELGEPDESGRRSPVPVQGTEYEVPVDNVIFAISQEPEYEYLQKEGYKLTRWKTFEVDPETYMTNIEGVFAAGDNTSGPRTAIEAIAATKKAIEAIHKYVMQKETATHAV